MKAKNCAVVLAWVREASLDGFPSMQLLRAADGTCQAENAVCIAHLMKIPYAI